MKKARGITKEDLEKCTLLLALAVTEESEDKARMKRQVRRAQNYLMSAVEAM